MGQVAGTGMHFEPTAHCGFSAGYNGDRAVARAPVGAVGQRESDGHYVYVSRTSKACTFGCSEHVACDDWDIGARATRASEYNQNSEAA